MSFPRSNNTFSIYSKTRMMKYLVVGVACICLSFFFTEEGFAIALYKVLHVTMENGILIYSNEYQLINN